MRSTPRLPGVHDGKVAENGRTSLSSCSRPRGQLELVDMDDEVHVLVHQRRRRISRVFCESGTLMGHPIELADRGADLGNNAALPGRGGRDLASN